MILTDVATMWLEFYKIIEILNLLLVLQKYLIAHDIFFFQNMILGFNTMTIKMRRNHREKP
jgi:hypothetical protein